jgi:FlaA1/EpsC-like NDP-sugar epimerase
MGASKRMAEQTVLAHAPADSAYCTVRFGNVLGSRGSVIPTFARQIAQGGPVTVTDPRMTRFFMSVEEAVQLVLQASVLSEGGEIFMLEMGVPVRIIDLAERMIRLSGCQVGIDIPIEITGMRPGEKLNEVLSTPDEEVLGTSHPYINRLVPMRAPADVFAAELEELELATLRRDKETVRELLFTAGVAPGSVPSTAGPAPAPDATRDAAIAPFEWPELDDAEAELDLRSMVADYMRQPEGDPDQVSA